MERHIQMEQDAEENIWTNGTSAKRRADKFAC
jgi:hypothetical protein